MLPMREWLAAHKPAAPARVHVLLAALTWSVVGLGLLSAGAYWTLTHKGLVGPPLLAVGILAGWAKSRLVLDKAAVRIVSRIRSRGDARCLGGFLSPGTWAMVAVMMLAGYLLRHSPVSRLVVGTVYAAVGAGLLSSSRVAWRAWHEGSGDTH
jgi:hypothetical protein